MHEQIHFTIVVSQLIARFILLLESYCRKKQRHTNMETLFDNFQNEQ